MRTNPPPANDHREPRRPWQAPQVECLDARPEISAYAGVGEPWIQPSR